MKKVSYSILLFFTFLLTGCPVPDIKDFSDATSLMATSISNSANGTLTLLVESFEIQKENEDIFNELKADKEDYPNLIRERWKFVDKTLSCLTSYADALNSIAHAGKKGQESFDNVADAIGGLAAVSGMGIQAIPEGLTEAGKFIYGKIAQIRAANSLKEVTTAADTSIQIIAIKLLENLDALKRLNHSAQINLLLLHTTKEVQRYRNYHKSLVDKELNLIMKITLLNDYENGDPESLIAFVYEDPISRDKLGLYDLSKEIEKTIANDALTMDQKIKKTASLRLQWDEEVNKILVGDISSNDGKIFSRYDINSSILEKIDVEDRLIKMKDALLRNREEILLFAPIIMDIDNKEREIYAVTKANEKLIEKSEEVLKIWVHKHKQVAGFFNKKQKISFNDIIGYASEINNTYQEFKENK
jgi:hypothetical protein